ncbi:unnamed protein product, partial [Mesorhabditis belari]|uniref:Calmodulin-binding domain-containing protein n=1 Tax=Mesorhabditis belari TaxID=2138241 RepID=A0AAF3JB14_9BILA
MGSQPKEIPITPNNSPQQAKDANNKLKEPLVPKRRDSSFQEVSADFLRLNGSRQQFRNLLSARKKLGQMPPAYTRVDCSRDSLDSQPFRPGHHGPVITVEDTGSQLKINRGKASITSSILDSTKSSFDRGNNITFVETGNGSVCGNHSNFNLRRNNSRYGVPINSSAVKLIYRVRAERLNNRVRIVDRALTLAMIGVVLMIIESEITGQHLFGISKEHVISLVMRSFVVLTTVALLFHILLYHINEIVLDLVDCGADDWRVVMTTGRIAQFVVEFSVCAICPIPGTGHLKWAYIETSRNPVFQADGQQPSNGFAMHEVPVDVILSLLMLFRSYLLARFMVLHSKQFQDASTRTLAALNRIQVNFSFVMKTLLDQQPIFFLTCFTLVFWILTSWTFVQCERYGNKEQAEVPSIMYSNALWFIAITFMLNGYGDIVPQTHAGRIIAIFVGVVGAIISSILIAVISRNILLSQGQRNVNNFMNDSKLTREHKHAAARVLQHTWYIHKCLQSSEPSADGMLRFHQRRFLHAIHRFRSIKNEIRVFGENNSANTQQVTRLVAEMHSSMQKLLSAHEEMRAQIEVLQRAVRNHYAHHGNCSSRVVFFEENPAVEGAESTTDQTYSHQVTSSNGSPGRSDSYSRKARRAFTVDSNFL